MGGACRADPRRYPADLDTLIVAASCLVDDALLAPPGGRRTAARHVAGILAKLGAPSRAAAAAAVRAGLV